MRRPPRFDPPRATFVLLLVCLGVLLATVFKAGQSAPQGQGPWGTQAPIVRSGVG